MNTGKEIKSKINCIDLAYELNLDLTKNGDSYRCVSFIRNDSSNPSGCQISRDFWYSYSDGVGGDVIDMLAYAKYNGDKSKAFRELANRFGLSSERNISAEYMQQMDFVAQYVESCHRNLRDVDREYLYKRCITDKTIDEFHIGYDQNIDRLIIPIFKNGKPVYWCARDRSGKPDVSKYTKANLTHNEFRENIMYGFDTLDPNENDTLIVAEGVFDYLSLHQEGYSCLSNATAISNENIKNVVTIASRFKRTILCFDNDVSGSAFTQRLYPALFRANIDFHVCDIPRRYGKDISDYYAGGNSLKKLFNDYITNGTIEYLKMKYPDFDELYDYAYENAPYISRKNKRIIIEYAETLTSDKSDIKQLTKTLGREKNQDEYVREFLSDLPYRLLYHPSLGFYEYTGKHWVKREELEVKQLLTIKFGLADNIEKAILNKLKQHSDVFTTKLPNEVNCLNLKNGTLYFLEGEYDPVNKRYDYYRFCPEHNPDDFCTYTLNYDYDPTAESDVFDNFLNSITSSDLKLQKRFSEYFGSIFLDKTIDRKGFLFYGNGKNGKSMLMETIISLLGGTESGSVVGLDFQGLAGRFGLEPLVGKRFGFFEESTSKAYDCDSRIKAILSNSTMPVEIKGKPSISVRMNTKLFFCCNELPKTTDQSDGWLERFKGTMHLFKNKFSFDESEIDNITVFQADSSLDAELRNPDTYPAILNWVLSGYVSVIQNGYSFSKIEEDMDIELQFASASNHLVLFATEYDWEHTYDVTTKHLFDDYKEWADRGNFKYPMNWEQFPKAFSNAIKTANRVLVNDGIEVNSARFYVGSKLERGYRVKK